MSTKRQKATAEQVEREASRYILHKLGDRLWAGEATYDERSGEWKVTIHSRSLTPNVALGEMTLDAYGAVVKVPSRRALQREFQRRESATSLESEPWLANLSHLLVVNWRYALVAFLFVVLTLFFWNRYTIEDMKEQNAFLQARQKEIDAYSEFLRKYPQETLEKRIAQLKIENINLRRKVEEAVASNAQTQKLLTTIQSTLERRITQLENENETLKASLAQLTTQPTMLVALQDTQGLATVDGEGTVRLNQETLPPSLSQAVSELVTKGTVTPAEPVLVAMAQLRGDTTRGELRSIRREAEKKPVQISPVLTAIRTTTPTLRWEAVLGVQKYQVTIADPEDEIIWQGNAGTQTQVTVPSGVLQHGQVYFWQVEAFMDGQLRLSPIVGFWVLNMETLREAEAAEQSYPNSALVLASVYQAHGLYEEALVQLERLADMNPTSPLAQVMLDNLRRQLGRK